MKTSTITERQELILFYQQQGRFNIVAVDTVSKIKHDYLFYENKKLLSPSDPSIQSQKLTISWLSECIRKGPHELSWRQLLNLSFGEVINYLAPTRVKRTSKPLTPKIL